MHGHEQDVRWVIQQAFLCECRTCLVHQIKTNISKPIKDFGIRFVDDPDDDDGAPLDIEWVDPPVMVADSETAPIAVKAKTAIVEELQKVGGRMGADALKLSVMKRGFTGHQYSEGMTMAKLEGIAQSHWHGYGDTKRCDWFLVEQPEIQDISEPKEPNYMDVKEEDMPF